MGKEYFEFLEEEFQALTSQLQKSLAAAAVEEAQGNRSDTKNVETQFTRCQAVFQQLKAEASNDAAFQDRFQLYKIQLQALKEHYRKSKDGGRQEVTYTLS